MHFPHVGHMLCWLDHSSGPEQLQSEQGTPLTSALEIHASELPTGKCDVYEFDQNPLTLGTGLPQRSGVCVAMVVRGLDVAAGFLTYRLHAASHLKCTGVPGYLQMQQSESLCKLKLSFTK